MPLNEFEEDLEHKAALAHFGVPGMKWGVRRAKKPALTPKERAEKYKRDGDRAVKLRKAMAVALIATYAGIRVAPLVSRAAGSVFVAAANRGAGKVSEELLSIGAKPVITLLQGADGVFRL